MILDNGADGYAYALNARTGELVWETHILDYRTGAKNSSGPIIANGKVISGRSCEPEGGPEACVITAFDAKTGTRGLAPRARFRSPASPATKPGATFRTRSAGTSACGWCRASIPS